MMIPYLHREFPEDKQLLLSVEPMNKIDKIFYLTFISFTTQIMLKLWFLLDEEAILLTKISCFYDFFNMPHH